MKPLVILSNNLFVPEDLILRKDLQGWSYAWTEKESVERKDEYGDLEVDAHGNPIVDYIEVEKRLKTFRRIGTSEQSYIALPKGDWPKIRRIVKRTGFLDLRSDSPLGVKLKLKRSVRKDSRWTGGQRRCVKEYCEKQYGLVKGDTGSGKTVIGAGIICKLGLKTIILTKRRDGNKHWIKQLRKLTNLTDLELRYGKELIGTYHSKNRKTYPITVATVQSFLNKRGFKDLIKFQGEFGLMMGDEVHELVTTKYRIVPLTFNTKAVVGLTATEERDDRLHFFEYDIFGPVVTENAGRKTKPTVTFIHTGVKAPMWIYSKPFNIGWKWNMCMSTLEKSKERYDLIMEWLHKDLADGLKIACISPQRRSIVQELARRLRAEGYRVAYVDGDTRNRERIYDDVNAGKYDILCAGKVLNALVDIQILNCIYLVTPLKKHAGTKQIYGRARQDNAVIRDFADEGGQLSGSFKSRVALCEKFGWKIEYVKGKEQYSSEPMGGWSPRRK